MRFSTILLSLVLIAGIAGMVCAQEVATLPAVGEENGYFSFNSVPSGADVVFDGIVQGETPVVAEASTTGNPQHTIQMTLAGYEPWSSSYTGNPAAGPASRHSSRRRHQYPQSRPYSDCQSYPSGLLIAMHRWRSHL